MIFVLFLTQKRSPQKINHFQERTAGYFGTFSKINNSLHKLSNYKIPFYFVDNHNSEASIKLYQDLSINCLFNAGTPRKLSIDVLNSMSNGVVNIHPGLLPKYRGCSCTEWAILNDQKIGNTAHYMDSDYDSGPIIIKESYDFKKEDNYENIMTKIYINSAKLTGKVLKKIETNNLTPNSQNLELQKDGEF